MVSPFSFRSASDTFVASYGRSAVTVVTRLRQRQIQAAVIPEPSLLPDPFFYYSFTEPMSLWFKQRGLFFLHAGCVTEAGAGILIVGNPRAGKSALTTSAVRGGFRFLADEQPLLSLHRGTLRAFAFPRRIRLDRSVARLFPELKELMKSNPSERLAFPIEKIWPGCLTLSCRPRLLLFPCYRPRKKLRTAPLSSSAVLKKLFRDPFFLWHRQRSLERISHLHLALLEYCARHLRGFTLEYGEEELHKIPALFRKLLSG
ncbi:MAG: hypothetical protein HYZ90_07020 [Candidatus Omnitrophica bacterium]|nr:hypothetical protein [Candidatus Omnitrophota bacterium]